MQACCILWATLGFKKAFKACFNYPALVLTPCFGTWTFGPAMQNNESTSDSCKSRESNKLRASYKHTWVTFIISLIGSIMTFFAVFGVSEFNVSLKNGFEGYGWAAAAVLISWLLTIVALPICIGFVQSVDKYRNFFTCCPDKFFSCHRKKRA